MPHKYPLRDLLRVRKFREDKAAGELNKFRQKLKEANARVVKRQQELTNYIEWRVRREEDLYQEILKQQVRLKALDDLKLDIQVLREKEFAYRERVYQAEEAVVQVQTELNEAHAAYEQALKNREKIDEHEEMWAQGMAKLDEAIQEKEMEDFRVRHLEGEGHEASAYE